MRIFGLSEDKQSVMVELTRLNVIQGTSRDNFAIPSLDLLDWYPSPISYEYESYDRPKQRMPYLTFTDSWSSAPDSIEKLGMGKSPSVGLKGYHRGISLYNHRLIMELSELSPDVVVDPNTFKDMEEVKQRISVLSHYIDCLTQDEEPDELILRYGEVYSLYQAYRKIMKYQTDEN